ncbi:hypothetical protein BDV26DRAFT_185214 [Aspergillus bertholletiae]|uniref:Uncharacterized protein n=1 Tax=Aspergillus bertholletiae TaxID=1226010 RepID=A0A5N7BAF1_9EURO|nr:hypothetical protein BDV26DRAFT_185214 [Aspergillus bertholletiae]
MKKGGDQWTLMGNLAASMTSLGVIHSTIPGQIDIPLGMKRMSFLAVQGRPPPRRNEICTQKKPPFRPHWSLGNQSCRACSCLRETPCSRGPVVRSQPVIQILRTLLSRSYYLLQVTMMLIFHLHYEFAGSVSGEEWEGEKKNSCQHYAMEIQSKEEDHQAGTPRLRRDRPLLRLLGKLHQNYVHEVILSAGIER